MAPLGCARLASASGPPADQRCKTPQVCRWLVEEQLSSYAIQKRLIERGIPTRKGSGRGWAQSMIISCLEFLVRGWPGEV